MMRAATHGYVSGLFWLCIRSLLVMYQVSFGYVSGLIWLYDACSNTCIMRATPVPCRLSVQHILPKRATHADCNGGADVTSLLH